MIYIGVLGIQGNFYEHISILKLLKIQYKIIKNKNDFDDIDGLIIPGGESTAIKKYINDFELLDNLKKFILKKKKPVFGTCAGAILLSNIVINNNIKSEGLIQAIDCAIIRNSYGSQADSFIEKINIKEIGEYECIFIRAPKIININKDCKVWADYNNNPIMISQENVLICTFHPELVNTKIHSFFINNFLKNKVY